MILSLNCGSRSIKWKLFDNQLNVEKSGRVEVKNQNDYRKILEEELKKLLDQSISLIGHRIVNGGSLFIKPARITEANIGDLEKISNLESFQNQYGIMGIKICQKIFKDKANMAVFDNEFFANTPEKFGFNGISHEYVSKKAAEKIKKHFNQLKIISCHLGATSSVAAIKNGKAIDVSDIKMTFQEGDASDAYVYAIKKYIGGYFAILRGCNMLIFTGAVGSGRPKTRNAICQGMDILKKTKIIAIETDEELAIAQKILFKK